MATREEFNTCMSPWIRGKDKSKEERKANFCIGAKICSGKAKTEAEAVALCNQPKVPKWAGGEKKKDAEAPEEKLSCPDRMQRVFKNLEKITELIKEGKSEEIKEPLVQSIKDIHECGTDEIKALANDVFSEIKNTTKDFYFKGEGREMVNSLNMVRNLLTDKSKEGQIEGNSSSI
jgi:vacuolar-type H+-ATPase subunit I/STV1